MNAATKRALQSFAGTNLWDTIRDEVIEEIATEFRDVSKPFVYGEDQLRGSDAYYAKVGASYALATVVKTINRLKKSKPSKGEDFE